MGDLLAGPIRLVQEALGVAGMGECNVHRGQNVAEVHACLPLFLLVCKFAAVAHPPWSVLSFSCHQKVMLIYFT